MATKNDQFFAPRPRLFICKNEYQIFGLKIKKSDAI